MPRRQEAGDYVREGARYSSKKWVFIDTGNMPWFSKYRRVGSNTVELRNKIATRQHRTLTNRNIRILGKIKDTQWFIEEVYIPNTVCRDCWEYLVIKATTYFFPISSLLPARFERLRMLSHTVGLRETSGEHAVFLGHPHEVILIFQILLGIEQNCSTYAVMRVRQCQNFSSMIYT
jgi:hypothetical protein